MRQPKWPLTSCHARRWRRLLSCFNFYFSLKKPPRNSLFVLVQITYMVGCWAQLWRMRYHCSGIVLLAILHGNDESMALFSWRALDMANLLVSRTWNILAWTVQRAQYPVACIWWRGSILLFARRDIHVQISYFLPIYQSMGLKGRLTPLGVQIAPTPGT
jgi:hypothetical protein